MLMIVWEIHVVSMAHVLMELPHSLALASQDMMAVCVKTVSQSNLIYSLMKQLFSI